MPAARNKYSKTSNFRRCLSRLACERRRRLSSLERTRRRSRARALALADEPEQTSSRGRHRSSQAEEEEDAEKQRRIACASPYILLMDVVRVRRSCRFSLSRVHRVCLSRLNPAATPRPLAAEFAFLSPVIASDISVARGSRDRHVLRRLRRAQTERLSKTGRKSSATLIRRYIRDPAYLIYATSRCFVILIIKFRNRGERERVLEKLVLLNIEISRERRS